jgi:hypothetical protein
MTEHCQFTMLIILSAHYSKEDMMGHKGYCVISILNITSAFGLGWLVEFESRPAYQSVTRRYFLVGIKFNPTFKWSLSESWVLSILHV